MSDSKVTIRQSIKQMRLNTSLSDQLAFSKEICSHINKLEQYRIAKRIGLYYAVNGEIDVSFLWNNAYEEGKNCYFPVLQENKTLIFLPATPETPFKKNRFGISEPDLSHDLAIPTEELDLMIIPLVAFDKHCNRLGMGAGYYDRTLENNKSTFLLGVGYDFQEVGVIEVNPWDVGMDLIVTAGKLYWRS